MNTPYHHIQSRLSAFSANIVNFVTALKSSGVPGPVIDQLVRSGTGVGANYAEARAAESPADFRHKLQVALKECREAKHWLETLRGTVAVPQRQVTTLLKECDEFCAILYCSVETAKRTAEGKGATA